MPILGLILTNYLVVLAGMLLFITPFAGAYFGKHVRGRAPMAFNERLEYFFSSQSANYLVATWAALEALVWWVIPEFLLLLVVFMRIRNKRRLLKYDLLGTAVGTFIAFIIPPLPYDTIACLPYIQPSMVAQTRVWYDQLGVFGLLFQPFSGVPYKVFTLSARHYGYTLPMFLVVAVTVRLSRYALCYGLFTGVYPLLHRAVYRNYVWLFFAACFIFSLLLLKVYVGYGPGHQVDYSSGEHVLNAVDWVSRRF